MDASTSKSPLSWETVFRPLGEKMSKQLAGRLADFHLGEEAQRRYDELAGKNTEGTLSETERVELQEFVVLNRMVGILKADAQIALQDQSAA